MCTAKLPEILIKLIYKIIDTDKISDLLLTKFYRIPALANKKDVWLIKRHVRRQHHIKAPVYEYLSLCFV